nr:cytokine receptor-like [Leptinotarsa decemlineata]
MEKTNGIFILILFFGCVGAEDKFGYCLQGGTLGFTIPRGDIVVEYDKSLNITCNLYPDIAKKCENASSYLYFVRNQDPIPKDMIEIVNSSSIRLYIDKPSKVDSDNYYCRFNESFQENGKDYRLVCMNTVSVGVAPQNVTNFTCIGRNLDNLTCSWEIPNNYVKTDYYLTYAFKKRKFFFPCPQLVEEGNTMRCMWNLSTNPQYMMLESKYYFTLQMNNTFGTNTMHFRLDHFKHVVPNPPENLTAVATSAHSIHLSWKISINMESLELHHRILYFDSFDKIWQVAGNITSEISKKNTFEFDLTNLKHAHALYDIRVIMRSAAAEGDDTMWSHYASATQRTKSDIPDCPPPTMQGTFELINNKFYRDAYVYWQQIKEEQENGQNFSYEVVVENNRTLRPTELTKAYAKFENLADSKYEISIWSRNDQGRSAQKSTIIIPESRIMEPENFVKTEHPGLTSEDYFYEVTWDPPKPTDKKITNYTVYWCDNDRDRPYQCEGILNWTVLPGDTFRYNLSLARKKIYQFAISANSETSTSGMTWAECTIIANKNVGKMRNVWITQVGSTFIELGWKLECTDGIRTVTGYVIEYCPIKSTQHKDCTENKRRNVTIEGNKSTQSGRVENLKPYTMYLITISVKLSNSTYSHSSDTMRNTTLEAAPSTPPIDISIYNVTNSSISLKWSPPLEKNGILKYYRIYYRNETQDVDKDMYNYTLTGLKSYENYSISMQACTTECSEKSPKQYKMTRMWLPGVIDRPNVIFQNDTVTTIGWKKPDPPRGEINYYQVKFTHNILENVSMEPDVNVTNAQNYSIEDCGESGKYNTFFVTVRAVNIIDGEHKAGPWSEPLESYCRHYSPLLYIIISVSLIFVAAGLFLGFRKLYAWCKVMQDVEVKLPPGLAPVVEQREIVLWGSEKHPDDIDRSSRADEQLLLEKISDIRTSAESSGCSSGHESITSSLDSTHMSIDSGTDQPRNMKEENRRNSLRQRNVSSKGYVLPDAIPTNNWGSKLAPAPAENYCVLGVDPTNNSEGNTPYQPITDISSSLSSPYISCDLPPNIPPSLLLTADLIKTPNPGYVPYSAEEPASKNTGYVVAGITKDLLGGDICQSVINPSTTKIGEKPYMKLGEISTVVKGPQTLWQPPTDMTMNKAGYVSVGDACPPKAMKEVTKGYVPHRQFEAKALKED